MQERRRYARWVISQPVRYKRENSELECVSHCRDISSQGISLEANQELPPDTPVNLQINLDEQGKILVRGKVIWQEPQAEDFSNLLTGINFITIKDSDKDKIFNYMFAHARTQVVENWWK
ncbi:MAG: PilZ domain-containing protein [Candidatus Omnitrophica bacterium]|nr:PilZ domain-containing protein [Candidatus Omnitrophota bacterium]